MKRQYRVKKEAAKWLIELDSSPNVEERWPEFEAWLNQDPQHRAAFTSMEKAWKAVEDLQVFHVKHGVALEKPLFIAQPRFAFLRPLMSLSWLIAAAVIFAGFVGIYAVFGPLKWAPVQPASWEMYASDYGEHRTVRLADGSLTELNANTQLRINRASGGREVAIDRGQVLFDVRDDPSHPFLVQAGNTSVRALGTTFSVWRKTDAQTVTLVKEGSVKVTPPAHESKVVDAQHTATAGPDGVEVSKLDPAKIDRMLSWKKGQLAFQGETLAEVVAEFNRYNKTQLKIDDPTIADCRIGGTYPARDPKGFAEVLGPTFGIRHVVVVAAKDSDAQVIHLSRAIP